MPRAGGPLRAPRLAVRAPADVRLQGRDGWLHGWTMNFSQSGVLLALRGAADLSGDVEFVIRLSDASFATPGFGLLPDLHGVGTVVRVSPGPAGLAFAAAAIRRQEVHPKPFGVAAPRRRHAPLPRA